VLERRGARSAELCNRIGCPLQRVVRHFLPSLLHGGKVRALRELDNVRDRLRFSVLSRVVAVGGRRNDVAFPPAMNSSGARSFFLKSTFRGVNGLRLALTPVNSTFRAAATAYRSYDFAESSSVNVFVKANWNSFADGMMARCRKIGFRSAFQFDRTVISGTSRTPRTVPAANPTPAAPSPRPRSTCNCRGT